MADRSVNVLINANDKASKKFAKIGKNANRLGGTLKKAFVLAGAYLGVRAIKNFASSSIAAFGEQERVTRLLSDALAGLGKGGAAAVSDMEAFAAEIQKITTIGDEATLEIAALGASMGGLSGAGLKQATVAAIGFSKALGMDTKGAMTLIAKAAQGNTDSFTRYGIVLDKNMTDQEKFQFILDKGAEGFKLAQGEADTFSGRVQQLSNSWGDFKETIGGVIANILPGLTTGFKVLQTVIENWRLYMGIAWESAKLGLLGFWENIKHTFGTAIPGVLTWFGDNWVNIFKNVWESTKTIVLNMHNNLVNFFEGVWSWVKGEGFDFKWTGLLDGFESTLAELPDVFDRAITPAEKQIAERIAGMRAEFDAALLAKMDTGAAALDTGGEIDPISGKPTAGKKKAGKQGGTTAEARFLSGVTRNKTEENTGAIVKINGRLVKLTEQMVGLLKTGTATGAGRGVSLGDIKLVTSNMA